MDLWSVTLTPISRWCVNNIHPLPSALCRYRFLARRTNSPFNKVVLKRLFLARSKKQPLSVSKIARYGVLLFLQSVAIVALTTTSMAPCVDYSYYTQMFVAVGLFWSYYSRGELCSCCQYSVSQMAGTPDKTAVVIGTVTDDIRMLDVPKLSICALRITEGARARVLKVQYATQSRALPTHTFCVAFCMMTARFILSFDTPHDLIHAVAVTLRWNCVAHSI